VGPERGQVARLRAQAPLEQCYELVEVRVEKQPALLEDDASEVAERIEPHAADVGCHASLPSRSLMWRRRTRPRGRSGGTRRAGSAGLSRVAARRARA